MRILVTGSAGFLGTHLVRELRSRGHEITGCDLRHWPGEMRADIADWGQLSRVFTNVKPEVCFNLAGEFGRRSGDEFAEQLWRTNCLGVRNIEEACLAWDTHLIHASSSEAYGTLADHGTDLTESLLDNYVPQFHNEYSLTKWCNEKQIQMAQRNHGLKATILRFFNVYGPGEYYSDYRSVVCLFIYRALKGLPITVYSETRRSFLYVDDWVRAVANVLNLSPDTFNIGSDDLVTMRTLMDMVFSEIPMKSEIVYRDYETGNVRDKKPDISRARELLDLGNHTSLRVGIRKTVNWMREVYP